MNKKNTTTKLINTMLHLHNFDYVKDQILYKLVSKDAQELEGRPYIPYLDLAINFHVVLEVVGSRLISIPIYNDFLKMWNVDVETLMACARNNISSLLPHKFSTLESIIKDLSTGMPLPDVEDEPPAFVLSNELNFWGATAILNDEVQKEIGNILQMNYFVIPSSIHELIIFPDDCIANKDDLREVICSVNEDYVDSSEVLSDHPYYYDRSLGKLLIP